MRSRPRSPCSPSPGALLAAGCGGREVVVRDGGGRVLVKAALPDVRALRARVPPLLLPRPGARALRGRRRRLPHGRGRVAQRGGARLLRDRGRQDAGALDGARARAPAALRPPAADRHPDRPADARGRRRALPAVRQGTAAPDHRGGGADGRSDTGRREARRGVRGREARPAARPDPREDRPRRLRGAVVLRDLLGAQPGAGAALPDELPARRARADVPRLPRLGRARREGQVREPGRHRLAAGARLGGRARLHARDVRRVRAPRRAAQRPRHRLRRRHDPARAGGDAPHGRLDPARGGDRLPALRLLRRRAAGELGHRARRLRRAADRRPDLHGPAGDLRRPARRRRHLHRAVHALRRGARVLRRRALLPRHLARRHRAAPHRPRPHDRDGGLPARHGVGLRRRHHRHARQRHLADPAPRRLPQGRGRRRARRLRHRRDPVAADARRRRVHHRRVPRRLLPDGAALRAIPSLLYYLGIFLAIEADARRFETEEVKVETPPAWQA